MKKILFVAILISLISISCSKAKIKTIEYDTKDHEICIRTNGKRLCVDIDPNKIIIR